MKIILSLSVLILIAIKDTSAQKKPIQNNSYETWTTLKDMEWNVSSLITHDGKYVAYKYGSPKTGDFVVIQSTDGDYKKEFKVGEIFESHFTGDSKRFIFRLPGDSLGILILGSNDVSYVKGIAGFSMPSAGNGRWLAFTNTQNELTIKDLFNGSEKKYREVEDYKFAPDGAVLLVKTANSLLWRDLLKEKDILLAKGTKIPTMAPDGSFKQLAFVSNNNERLEIRYYKPGMDSAKVLVNSRTDGLKENLSIADGELSFSSNGKKLFFRLKETAAPQSAATSSPAITDEVEIWHYQAPFIPADELAKQVRPVTYLAVCNINAPKVIQLTNADISFLSHYGNDARGNDYVLAETNDRWDGAEFYWNKHTKCIYLVSTQDGSSKELARFSNFISEYILLSPNEKFVVWFNDKDHHYYSYEIATGVTRNISEQITASIYDHESEIISRRKPYGVAGWINDGNLLIYGRFDIWKIDLSGKKAPLCITGGAGQKDKVIFRRAEEEAALFKDFTVTDTLLLAGLDDTNKDNGFWKVGLNEPFTLTKCEMGPYVYYFPRPCANILNPLSEYLPRKAQDANIYVVRRMGFKESPNLFLTHDLKTFRPLTNIHPERGYNWLTAELVNWQIPGSKLASGILYKPEDFDPTKKYPVIFYYYEKLSDGLNIYKAPELSIGTLSIPWYVSNGYLVFVPDIYYERGKVAQSVVNTITSAVGRLSQFSWIDTSRIGLQGHSFGGFETLVLITRTKLFAAAQESAGYTNAVSYYNQRTGFTSNRNQYFDIEQGNLGSSPWEKPELFIDQSPIFHVNNISTPLLLMHNPGDDNVDFHHAVELFISLRRLRKPAWMLQYKDENHTIRRNEKNQLDFTIRQQQFFDHYLKGAPAPKWMTTPGSNSIELGTEEIRSTTKARN